MRLFFLVIALSLHLGYLHGYPKSDSSPNPPSNKHGSHNLLKLETSNSSVNRNVRCTPCESRNEQIPISNHLNPEYRGNGADNLGYDWSPRAWGGLAFPHRSKGFMGGMRGRDGRMMIGGGGGSGVSGGGGGGGGGSGNWVGNQEGFRVICDTCRTYWTGSGGGRGGSGDGRSDRGRMFNMPGGQDYYGGQGGYWQGDRMMRPQDFETRVSSPTVGVLVRPGSRIAYIPSRSGEMYWDGVSGGGTRWDGFSNGISWVANGAPEWDRMDLSSREDKPGYTPTSPTPGTDYPYNSPTYRPWDGQKGTSAWDNSGRGYYFANGVPNQMDPQWTDRGYASNWHYGSTNQHGWNGNNMKWNYGGKQWDDNDRAANRFYFNSPQDRGYSAEPSGGGGNYLQYGNQYPNYEPSAGYPGRGQPSWHPNQGYRVNDRDPSSFQPANFGDGDKNRPWDYTSGDRFGFKRPGPRPDVVRPGPSYPSPGTYDKDSSGKYPPPYRGGYPADGKYPGPDRIDYEKPWSGRPGYGPSKPDSGGGFPYGGNRFPGGSTTSRPTHGASGGHLFYPNEGNARPEYPSVDPGFGSGPRPSYPSGGTRPGGYPSAGSHTGSYPSGGARPTTGYPNEGTLNIIYTGGGPSVGGSSSGGYPSGGSPSGGYPSTESSLSGYPSGGSTSGGYPIGGSRPAGYPSGGSITPTGGSRPGGYPVGGSYPDGGSRPGSYPTGGRPGSYPSRPGGYPDSGGRPSGYPDGGGRPGGYPDSSLGRPGGYPDSSGRPGGYPDSSSRPGGYPDSSGRPGGYPSTGNRPDIYPGGGGSYGGYPSGGGSSYPSGVSRPGGYPSGVGGQYPGVGGRPGSYPSGGSGYPGDYGGSGAPIGYPSGGGRPSVYPGESGRPGGYPSGGRPVYPSGGGSPTGYPGTGSGGSYPSGGNRIPPKGYYTGFITELGPDDGTVSYGGKHPSYFGGSYPGDKNGYPGKDKDRNPYGGGSSNKYPISDKDRYPYGEDRYSGGGGSGYPSGDRDKYGGYNGGGGDRYYYGLDGDRGKLPGGFPSNHRYPGSGSNGDFDRNSNSSNDKNAWNYGQEDRKDGIYRRSGGSYPPYRGGQYYTSSYLASMSTTSGSTQSDAKTTKADDVTEATPESS